jgi:hypothetical protein
MIFKVEWVPVNTSVPNVVGGVSPSKIRLVKPVQDRNALLPILVTLLGMVRLVNC